MDLSLTTRRSDVATLFPSFVVAVATFEAPTQSEPGETVSRDFRRSSSSTATNFGEFDMQKPCAILFAIALSALVPVLTYAGDQGDPVKTGRTPYKPGREITTDTPADAAATPSTSAAEDEGKPVKPGKPPYKPGREIEGKEAAGAAATPSASAAENEGQPVKPAKPPYKPGRQAEDKTDKEDK